MMPLSRRTQIIIFVIVVAILVVIAGFWVYGKFIAKPPLTQAQISQIIQKGDPTACNQIGDVTIRDNCENTILINLARQKQDASYCGQMVAIGNQIADCELMVASDKADQATSPAACQGLTTDSEKNACLTEYYSSQAVESNDISLCSQIAATADQNDCRDNFYLWRQYVPNPKGFNCNKYINPQMKAGCLKGQASSTKK